MTERLADIRARVEGMRQLGGVVNAMRGIAAARAQQARSQLVAGDRTRANVSGPTTSHCDTGIEAPSGGRILRRTGFCRRI